MKKLIKLNYIVLCICMLMPWFTYNAKLMGYCRGTDFMKWMIIPFLLMGHSIYNHKKHIFIDIMGIISAAVLLFETVIVLGNWQYFRNIIGGFHWRDGFHTALPFYWITLIIEAILLISLIIHSYRGK